MRTHLFIFGVIAWSGLATVALAEEDLLADPPPPVTEETLLPPAGTTVIDEKTGLRTDSVFVLEAEKKRDAHPSPLLAVGGRIDVAFSSGSPVSQGFFLPSLRLNAAGSVGRHLDYGMAIGQTREFSSALLPQLLPVEAYMTLKTMTDPDEGAPLKCRIGMFNPMLNPWWTPDLAALPLPDYNAIHRAILLDNDVGLELSYQPISDRLEVSLGFFNGNGIFSPNTNNSKAFTGSLRTTFPFGGSSLSVGFGAYSLEQSGTGSVNYKSNWATSLFASLTNDLLTMGVDVVAGSFEDSTRIVYPGGGGGFVNVALMEGVSVFARLEGMQGNPLTAGGSFTQFQLGPHLELDKAFRVFFYYESLTGLTGNVSSGQLRLRLSI